jgi:hypothetical protein
MPLARLGLWDANHSFCSASMKLPKMRNIDVRHGHFSFELGKRSSQKNGPHAGGPNGNSSKEQG